MCRPGRPGLIEKISPIAEVNEVKTAYVFTGQGSAEPGMGMDRYNASPAVKAVWDEADKHLLATYGFSILDIVRRNPKSLTVYFGGKKGAAIKRNYMKLKVESPDGTGLVPLIPKITALSRSYTFESPVQGLLFSTQFTQPALVLLEKSQFTELYNEVSGDTFSFAHVSVLHTACTDGEDPE